MKKKSLYYFHKKLKIQKTPKKKTFLVGFLGVFFGVFLGGSFWLGFLMPTLPQGEHDLREQGGGHQLRPARGERAHPDLQPRGLAAAGGAAPGPHPARQEGRAR